jgi:peptide/nickel transport system permease protein
MTTFPESEQKWVDAGWAELQLPRLRRLGRSLRSPAVSLPGLLFLGILLACFAWPEIADLPSPVTGDLAQSFLPMGSPGHLLGTNELGNDVLSRLLYGGRVSIVVGFGATVISFIVGTLLGMTAGFFGGFYETVVMRFFDTLLAFPGLILALVIADYLGPSLTNTTLAISVFGVSRFGRLAWSQTLTVRHHDFVTASRCDGSPSRRVILGHILPNVMPPLLGFALFTVGTAMMIEAGLSYLGLGVPQPEPTWGNMIGSGDAFLSNAPRLVVLPSVALFLCVLSLNLLADGLRDRMSREA